MSSRPPSQITVGGQTRTLRPQVKQTSLDAYDLVVSSGNYGKQKEMVLVLLGLWGDMTQKEVQEAAFRTFPSLTRTAAGREFVKNLQPRFAPLCREGKIRVVGERLNPKTGANAEVWDLCPEGSTLAPERKASRAELIEALRGSEELLGEGSPPDDVRDLREDIRDILRREG